MRRMVKGLAAGIVMAWAAGAAAEPAQLRFMCYGDGDECVVMSDLLKRFEAAQPGIRVTVDTVSYKTVLESLPVQLAAGQAPDLARVSDLGGLNRYYLDISDRVDREAWENAYGDALPWFRAPGDTKGVFGVMTQLTVTGAFVNQTLFEQAGVELPGPKATWDEWAAAASKVAKATETPFAMAIDRSGHRISGPAISYGAKLLGADGKPAIVDDGFKAFAGRFVAWNQDGTIAKDVWAGSGGSTYQDAAQDFINGQIVLYYSGSWQVQRLDQAIGDAFDWKVVGSPCGPAACSGMPGGAAMVGFKSTGHPEAVAKVIDWFAGRDVQAELAARTRNIPPRTDLVEAGVTYEGAKPAVANALNAFREAIPAISPIAYQLQGYNYNRAIYNAMALRLTQAIVGETTLDDAFARIDQDVAEAVKTSGGK